MIADLNVVAEVQTIIMEWGKRNYTSFPWRSTKNQFHALVAEIMLQRTRAEQVKPIYELFTLQYQSPSDVTTEEPEKIRLLLHGLGLKWRTEKILNLCKALVALNGKVPRTLVGLLALPGIGTYVASAYLSLHAGVRMPIVDSNVVRLWSRIFGFHSTRETRRDRHFLDFADFITPEKGFKEFNYAVLDFTRKVCRPKPQHDICPLTAFCKHYLLAH